MLFPNIDSSRDDGNGVCSIHSLNHEDDEEEDDDDDVDENCRACRRIGNGDGRGC